jgi:2-hydroxy-3-keto-5-methylthiopentenyl-1-phosphate phosphatase
MEVLPRDGDLLRREAAGMAHDPGFVDFVARVRRAGAQIEVVSDGLGFYVASNLAALGLGDLPIATNENRVEDGARGLNFPFGHQACFVCGTCKRERVRARQAAGWVVVFIGEGTSDRFAAAHADLVFAKDALALTCGRLGWPFRPWRDFSDLAAQVEGAFADGALPRRPSQLAAWRARHAPAPRAFICGPEVWGPGRHAPPHAPGGPQQSLSGPQPPPGR